MNIYKKYENHLKIAKGYKADLIQVRTVLKSGRLFGDSLAAALSWEKIVYNDAIENWEKSQIFLSQYNEAKKDLVIY